MARSTSSRNAVDMPGDGSGLEQAPMTARSSPGTVVTVTETSEDAFRCGVRAGLDCAAG